MKQSTVWIIAVAVTVAFSGGAYWAYRAAERGDANAVPSGMTGSASSGLASSGSAAGLANPASAYCIQRGGTVAIKKNPSGAEYGVCYFEDNRQCEEWAFLRGNCPYGGRRITGYDDEAEIFCAISGGTVRPDNNPVSCELPEGAGSCSAASFFASGAACVRN